MYRRREIFKAGLLGYKRKALRMISDSGFSKHQLGSRFMDMRRLRKQADKCTWYKRRGKGDMLEKKSDFEKDQVDSMADSKRRNGDEVVLSGTGPTNVKSKPSNKPVAVLFVQRTEGGKLLREMRKKEEKINKVTEDNIRLVERAGTPLERILVNKNPWAKDRCDGINCGICGESGRSVCLKTGVVYKHTCLLCKADGKVAIYIGQTSKSLAERAKEHEKALGNKSPKSHAWNHISECHPEEAEKMIMTPDSGNGRHIAHQGQLLRELWLNVC